MRLEILLVVVCFEKYSTPKYLRYFVWNRDCQHGNAWGMPSSCSTMSVAPGGLRRGGLGLGPRYVKLASESVNMKIAILWDWYIFSLSLGIGELFIYTTIKQMFQIHVQFT